uniref:Reverse transcriptase domain-containing protein n=1 Tax=Cannabis sativa TaxID=3483 RepID=A0A803QSC4_CANSA
MTRCSRRHQYMEIHLDGNQLIASERDPSTPTIRKGNVNIRRPQIEGEPRAGRGLRQGKEAIAMWGSQWTSNVVERFPPSRPKGTVGHKGKKFHRPMLIDNRSLVDILYFIALKKTGLGLKDLKFYASLIYGFTGDNRVSPHSLGMTSTFHGDGNLFGGGLSLNQLKAFTSEGIRPEGRTKEAIECYNMSLKIATKPREPMTMTVHGGLNLVGETSSKLDAQVCEEVLVESMEELEEIVILENPFKILKIGKGLLEALKRELRQNLENNVDVLTWSHEDMEGVDPTLMCHHLNIDPNARLVRQK